MIIMFARTNVTARVAFAVSAEKYPGGTVVPNPYRYIKTEAPIAHVIKIDSRELHFI